MTQLTSVKQTLLNLREEADKLPPEMQAFADETVLVLAQLWGYMSHNVMTERIDRDHE